MNSSRTWRSIHIADLIVWFYAGSVITWLVLRALFADSWWWLALLNTFAPYLFIPLVLTTPIALARRNRSVLAGWLVPAAVFMVMFGQQWLPRGELAAAAPAAEIRVMTFNVGGRTSRAQPILQRVQAESPDLVFLQELRPVEAQQLAVALRAEYPYQILKPIGRMSMPGNPSAEGAGILSRYPLDDLGWLQLGDEPNAVQRAEMAWQGERVLLLNVSLPSVPLTPYLDEMPGRLERSFQRREQETRDLMAFVQKQSLPQVLAGDFNTTDTTAAYGLMSRELSDAQREAGWGLAPTFPATGFFRPFPISIPIVRIDYIFYSSDWGSRDAYVAPWDGQSDHLAFVATLELKASSHQDNPAGAIR